jgi:hypothetical protein
MLALIREYHANRLLQDLRESVLLTYFCFSKNETSDISGAIHVSVLNLLICIQI